MPELPEVETIKRSLEKKVVGKIISEIQILSPKNFIGNKKDVIGGKIVDVARFGKVLVFKIYKPKIYKFINCHFKLSGQMLFAKDINQAVFKNKIPFTKGKRLPANTTRVIIEFEDQSGLFFNDLRKFGWIKITQKPIKPKGVDVLSKEFNLKKLKEIVLKKSQSIKLILMNQDLIAGIGNIYANDALFLARIHPLQKGSDLTTDKIKNLYQSIKKLINQAIKNQGSSGADEAYILPDGSKGKQQRNFLVYQREKKPCIICQTPIKRFKQSQRSTFFCPNCQKL